MMTHMVTRAEHRNIDNDEKQELIRVLRQTNGNKRQAAQVLQISRGTLYRRLKVYDLTRLIRQPGDGLDQL